MSTLLNSPPTRRTPSRDAVKRGDGVLSTRCHFLRAPLTSSPPINLRVLCVDDLPDSADSISMLLELFGCHVETSYNGHAALVLASEFRPQVCLLDLRMPGMDGFELARRLRESVRGRPLLLIAVTADGTIETKRNCLDAGFDLHLTKPVDVQALWTVLRDF